MTPTAVTVPANEVVAWLTLNPARLHHAEALGECGRVLGCRVELDLGAVAQTLGADLADELAGWHDACSAFRERFRSDAEVGPWVVVRRSMCIAHQKDGADGKADLIDEYEALKALSGVGELVEAVTSTQPDWDVVTRKAAVLRAEVHRDGATTTVTIPVDWHPTWPTALGGPGSDNELVRTLRITARHAAWRDRRTRRLVAVVVETEEAWPDTKPSLPKS